MLKKTKNLFMNQNRYREHSEAVIISCFFNPQNSPYRKKAFDKFYESIEHMDHLVMECIIGDAKPQLPENENIQRIYTENLLWHKEALLNLAIAKLPAKYKYVFWVDADVLFTNKDWLVRSVDEMKSGAKIIQPFEWCVHLEKDETEPSYDIHKYPQACGVNKGNRVWRSFCANCVDDPAKANSKDYDTHGHVGFAWGATRELLKKVPLYDRALIGGADHIIAHAAQGQIPCSCINKSFTDDLDAVYEWSAKFGEEVRGKIAYTEGDLYHIWHGDIEKRQYLKRIQEFTPTTKKIVEKDANGLHVTKSGDDVYVKRYFAHREVKSADDGFMNSMAMGYMLDDPLLGMAIGGNPAGAILGAAMNPHHSHNQETQHNPQTPTGKEHAPENFS